MGSTVLAQDAPVHAYPLEAMLKPRRAPFFRAGQEQIPQNITTRIRL